KRWNLSKPGLHRSAVVNAGDAGRAGRIALGSAPPDRRSNALVTPHIWGGGRVAGSRDDYPRHHREDLMTDKRMEVVIANLLRAGVALAAALVLLGGAWYVAS